MMEEEQILIFFVEYGNDYSVIQLPEYDTVELLKLEIYKQFKIPEDTQVIEGWGIVPQADDTILKVCVKDKKTHLKVFSNKDLEIEAGFSFFNKIQIKFSDVPLTFHTCQLTNVISTICLGPLEQRKVLLLYLRGSDDQFSSDFLNILRKPVVLEILKRRFFLLGWDTENSKFHGALEEALEVNELSNILYLVKSKLNAILLICPNGQSVDLHSCIRGKISEKSLIEDLTTAEKLILENMAEENNKCTTFDMDSEKFQQLMADMLGDRDYDGFEPNQHEMLKEKIGFALFGPPKSDSGYGDKEKKEIDKLFETILENNNEIAEYKDRVEISFIYNCVEPLNEVKEERAKKFSDYNPKTDHSPIPLFVLRKCRESDDPCRLFIDNTGRVYESFQDYKESNKLHKCTMVLPSNGRYTVSDNDKVQLERCLSPACDSKLVVLKCFDCASTAGGLVSGGVFLTAAIPAITVAPAFLIGASVVGAGAGLYGLGRSVFTLFDKNEHKESISFADSQARGAYLNIVAGSLGFVGAGSNFIVSQLVARGVNIGKGASAVVNTIGIANIGASGASLVNSSVDLIDQWVNEGETPSMLTIIQLSSSVLFFGNAVYNFKTCGTIVEETQARTLQDYQESLRSNRHRKTFNKLMKATIGQNGGNEVAGKAEVIAAIRNIQNKDEVFATLTRNNKNMNRNGVKFTASGGEIKFNGMSIDMNEFMNMNKQQTSSFLSNLPTNVDVTVADTAAIGQMFSFNNIAVSDFNPVLQSVAKLLVKLKFDVQEIVIEITSKLLSILLREYESVLDKIFPNRTRLFGLINVVLQYFEKKVDEMETQYKEWRSTGDPSYYHPIFEIVDVEKAKRWFILFEYAIKLCMCPSQISSDLIDYSVTWLAAKHFDLSITEEQERERLAISDSSPSYRINCTKCQGYYYKRN